MEWALIVGRFVGWCVATWKVRARVTAKASALNGVKRVPNGVSAAHTAIQSLVQTDAHRNDLLQATQIVGDMEEMH